MFPVIAWVAVLFCYQVAPAPQAETRQAGGLALHQPVERDLAAGQTDVFTADASAGQFLHVTVEKHGVEAFIILLDPDGKTILTADSGTGETGLERASLIAARAGKYEIRVQKAPQTAHAGQYKIELTDLRAATEQDRTRIQAEAEMYTAVANFRTEDHQKWQLAIDGYERAAPLWHSLGEPNLEALCFHRIGYAYRFLDEHRKAVDAFTRAVPVWRTAGDRNGEASSLNSMANSLSTLGERPKALDLYNQALSLWRALGNRGSEGNALSNIGFLYSALGENRKALEYYAQALPLRRAAGDRAGEAMTLHNSGMVYAELGDPEKALDFYNQALVIWRALGNRVGEADTLYNISGFYQDLGENQKALDTFQLVLPVFRALGSRQSEALSLLQLGGLHSGMGDHPKAQEDFLQALAIMHEVGDHAGEAQALDGVGQAYFDQGDTQKAAEYFQQSLAVERAAGSRGSEAASLEGLGTVYLRRGDSQAALRTFAQALQLAAEVSNPTTQATVLADLMTYWQQQREVDLAVFFGKQAINQYQSIRRNTKNLDQDLKQSYLARVGKTYRQLADLLIGQGRLSEAEEVLALLKEEEFFNYLRRSASESAVDSRASLNRQETEADKRYREISDSLVQMGAERGDLVAKKTRTPEEAARLDQLEKDLAIGNAAFEKFIGDLAAGFQAKPAGDLRIQELRETQGIMEDLRELPKGTVAIYTLVGEDKLRCILRTPDVQKAYEFPIKSEELNRKIAEFRSAILDPRVDPRPLAQDLYKVLIGPMARDLRAGRAQTLMWSLDGALRYLPIAALFDGKQYLIEQYRISVMTLASNARLKDRPDREWRAAGFGVTKQHDDVEALPEVAAEMEGIGKILHGEIKLDEQFTEESLRTTLLKRYPVVHIASHFKFQPGNEAKSFLLLGDGGHLSMAELKTFPNLFGGVQLLTLSACNTGIGDGAEVEGFGTLAQRQGAKAVVASLWSVADESTSQLMQEFYRVRETSRGMTKLEALREAQLKLLHGNIKAKSGNSRGRGDTAAGGVPEAIAAGTPRFRVNPETPYAHPFYWAPFFLMGNWL